MCMCNLGNTFFMAHPFRDDVFLLIGPRWQHGEHACLLVMEDKSLNVYDINRSHVSCSAVLTKPNELMMQVAGQHGHPR